MLSLFVILTIFFSTSTSATEKKVLIINSYHKGMKWVDDAVLTIEKVLENTRKTEVLYMDTKRQSVEKFKQIADLVWDKYL